MRRFYYFLPVVALFFGGCLSAPDDSGDFIESFEYETERGIIQSLGGVKFNDIATHLLRTDGGDIYYVYSDFYDLNDSSYLNQHVEVYGVLIPMAESGSKDTLGIETLKILTEEEAEEVEVTEEIYVSDLLGMAIMYRSDWSVLEEGGVLSFVAPLKGSDDSASVDRLEFLVMDNLEEIPLEDWYVEYKIPGGASPVYNLSVVGMDQLSALRLDSLSGTAFYVADGPQVLFVSHVQASEEERLEYDQLISEMLYSLDLLRDGQREPLVPEETDAALEEVSLEGTDYEQTAEAVQYQLNDLVGEGVDWIGTRLDFVAPDYIYVEYANDEGVERRLLIRQLSSHEFEVLARFKAGSSIDWILDEGEDEARGKEKVSLNLASGSTMTIPEGFRAMESAPLAFSMYYPASWYYARGGDFIYFSDEPANADNALVSLKIDQGAWADYEVGETDDGFYVRTPRNGESHFYLEADASHQSELRRMAESIVSVNP